MFTLLEPTPEERAETEAYWADVRKGIAEHSPHVYKIDNSATIDSYLVRANNFLKLSEKYYKMAKELKQNEN